MLIHLRRGEALERWDRDRDNWEFKTYADAVHTVKKSSSMIARWYSSEAMPLKKGTPGDALVVPGGLEEEIYNERQRQNQGKYLRRNWKECKGWHASRDAIGWWPFFCYRVLSDNFVKNKSEEVFRRVMDCLSESSGRMERLMSILWPDYPTILFKKHRTARTAWSDLIAQP
jgi:hypothetical protein